MNPEQEIKELKEKNAKLEERLAKIEQYTTSVGGSFEFKNLVQLYSGEKTLFNTIRTTNFAISKTPVPQQASIADPSGGVTVDTEARAAVDAILDVLDAYGLTA